MNTCASPRRNGSSVPDPHADDFADRGYLRWASRLLRRLSLARYVLVGGFNTALDFGLYTLLVTAFWVPPLIANVVSTVVTMCVSYLLNRTFVFHSNQSHARGFLSFVAVTLTSGLVIQSIVIAFVITVGESFTSISHNILATGAKVCAICVSMVFNYLGYRYIFRSRNAGEPTGHAPYAESQEDR